MRLTFRETSVLNALSVKKPVATAPLQGKKGLCTRYADLFQQSDFFCAAKLKYSYKLEIKFDEYLTTSA
jgi:hypothetical protein